MSLYTLNNHEITCPVPGQDIIIETFYEFCLEFSLCLYSVYFWKQLSYEYIFLKEHLYIFCIILFKIFRFFLHLILLAISTSIALNFEKSDVQLEAIQLTLFIAILDFTILRNF